MPDEIELVQRYDERRRGCQGFFQRGFRQGFREGCRECGGRRPPRPRP